MKNWLGALLGALLIVSVGISVYVANTLRNTNSELGVANERLDALQSQLAKPEWHERSWRFIDPPLGADNLPASARSTLGTADSERVPETMDTEQIRTLAEAQALWDNLETPPSARKMAECLSELDSWIVQPKEDDGFRQLKLQFATRLRAQVKQEVVVLQEAALKADTGAEAAEKHTEAGQALALYPMADDQAVLDEAKALSAQQAECINRLEVLRRQRYNNWASKQIEAAIDGYNSKSTIWSPKKENALLIASLVDTLGDVDPVLLEPVVLELYNYVVDLTKGSISESDKIALAKKMTNPSLKRRTLGAF